MPLPLVHRLPDALELAAAFKRLAHRGGCLWLDSAAPGPLRQPSELSSPEPVGRYSFLTADPVHSWHAWPGDTDPWPDLQRCAAALQNASPIQQPDDRQAATSPATSLPPFQGGLAGLWGYEAAAWLEPLPLAHLDDLPTPAIHVGLYDWVIAQDHLTGHTWLISQGYTDPSLQRCPQRAQQRQQQVLQWLTQPPAPQAPLGPPIPLGPQLPPAKQTALTTPATAYQTPLPAVSSNFSSDQYRAAVEQVIDRICQGDCFQVNLSQRLVTPADEPSEPLYLRLRQHNPAPMAGYYDGGTFQLLSSSPESFLQLRHDCVQTRPIKGTVPRYGDRQRDRQAAQRLAASHKDRAENIMIVDLMRSDLARVCDDDSVRVLSLCQVEPYAFVQHLVSVVSGRLRAGLNAIDLLAACFPGGSITGAPKIEAMRTIAHCEPTRRGPYCGALGYVSCGGAAEFNILIRTVTATAGTWQFPVGGGITAQSNAAAEEQETWDKAAGMLSALRGGIMRP